MTRILIFGATGMLGNAMLRYFAECDGITVAGTSRSARAAALLPAAVQPLLISGVDAGEPDSLLRAVGTFQPTMLVNAMGLVKQLADANDPLAALPMNALLPHRLQLLAAAAGARLVHVSTDCVFTGKAGHYREDDVPDAVDLYGRSKLLGEVGGHANAVTLRTSIIGRELGSVHGLVDWFLAQHGSVKGYVRAIFSGVPTVELARIVHQHVLPDASLHGVYHVAAAPICKFDLLHLIARTFGHEIEIVRDESVVIDRSLDASRFNMATGYSAPAWPDLIERMQRFG